jgi:hypothetical protein
MVGTYFNFIPFPFFILPKSLISKTPLNESLTYLYNLFITKTLSTSSLSGYLLTRTLTINFSNFIIFFRTHPYKIYSPPLITVTSFLFILTSPLIIYFIIPSLIKTFFKYLTDFSNNLTLDSPFISFNLIKETAIFFEANFKFLFQDLKNSFFFFFFVQHYFLK